MTWRHPVPVLTPAARAMRRRSRCNWAFGFCLMMSWVPVVVAMWWLHR